MKITLLQTDITWMDRQENIQQVEKMMEEVTQSDVYVLPEMWDTGFVTQPALQTLDAEKTLAWMTCFAKEHDAAIVGSMSMKDEGGTWRNRMYFVTPEDLCYYDKRHLFSYGHEDETYRRGEERKVVEWRGVRFLLQVCYDLRFPVFSRNKVVDAVADYDCVIYVASWPESRQRVWDTLLKARAMENQCYVVGVNRVGDDPQCHYAGGTVVIDAYGRVVAECQPNKMDVVSATIDIEKLNAFRRKFPVLADAD